MLINLSLGFKTALGLHTSLEHSKLGHKPRMLKGNSYPKAPIRPLQAHLQRGHAPDIELASGSQVIEQVKKIGQK